MTIDNARIGSLLADFNLPKLFIEELGCDNPSSRQSENIEIAGKEFLLTPIAQKREFGIFHCSSIPERSVRQKLEREIAKRVYEHLIIFTDPEKTQQVWQWVAREKGKPDAFREYVWHTNKSPEGLIQKLAHIAFTLDEEEELTLTGVTRRMKDAFDREKITKKFYEAFKKQHDAFLEFIEGLENKTDRQWYASLMLNRLMFVYFIQKKGFLDNNRNYLSSRLDQVREIKGEDQFHSFYRVFLLKLFHGGLATPKDDRDADIGKLLGNIPYLNGGLFEPHALEAEGNEIQIGDAAFESVFSFFDQYEWTLDTRAIERADGKEINPDVLGHIFEKYINQKQMGAYYTKEDITDYITKNTVIPWLFQNAILHDKVAFEPGGAVWSMLSENPDAYIYESVKHGIYEGQGNPKPLPDKIAAGIDDVSARSDWNRTAPSEFGLPTEIWREVVARRERYEDIRAKAASGEISTIEDFVTYNLDIRQFARDVIQYAESPDLVRAFWKGIKAVTVLDPACGSGAFLFAALNILYDLYDACLERMEEFVETAPKGSGPRQKYSDFREVLKQVEQHPNRDYFIYKSIILSNLYGVDIMDEAVEICKLRLFLKLASQLERADQIEPLPDIDFNIRAGNSLIGYTSLKDVQKATQAAGFDFENRAEKIEAAAQDLDSAFRLFRQQQTALHGTIEAAHKADLRERLGELESQLDRFLAKDYGVDVGDDLGGSAAFSAWKVSHQPFHWWSEFYGIMADGGFDVVVGNPPYIQSSKVKKEYQVLCYETERCSDIYAWIMERAAVLASAQGLCGMIVPLSLSFSGNFQSLRNLLWQEFPANWFASFARIPAALFSAEVRVRNTIHIGMRSATSGNHTTITHRWFEEARPHLVERIEYARFDPEIWDGLIPKWSNSHVLAKLEELKKLHSPLDRYRSRKPTPHCLHFKKSAYNWVSFALTPAPTYGPDGELIESSEYGEINFDSAKTKKLAHTLLNGKFGLMWWMIVGDDFHVTQANFGNIPLPVDKIDDETGRALQQLHERLDDKMNERLVFKLNAGKRVGNYNLAQCRSFTDCSDLKWAKALHMSQMWDEIELGYAKIVKTSFDDDVSAKVGGET
jgi:type I restriction-modification system DNA methylase subunit